MTLCFVVGTDLGNVFEVDGQIKMTIAKLKDIIYEKNKYDFENKRVDANTLNLWLVDIPCDTENVKLRTLQSRSCDMDKEKIIIQELGGKKLFSADNIGDIFTHDSNNIRIIVQPPVSPMHIKIEIKNKAVKAFPHINILSIDKLIDALALIWNVETVESDLPSSQNDPCAKLKMTPSFFKINLPSTITQQSATPVDLRLPPYESKSGMNYLNPFYDDPQFIDTVSLVQEKLINNPRDVTILAGVSGGGKTSIAFGISIQRWTIYVDFSPSGGQYGDFMGQELERIRARPPMYGQTEEQSKVFDMLDFGIISRGLLLIKMLVQEKISTPKEWLFAQLRIMNTNKITNALQGNNVSLLFHYIIKCLGINSLTLIFDEAQVLCGHEYGEYNVSSQELWKKKWNLLQAYIEHLTHHPVTCLIVGTHMNMTNGISPVIGVGKIPSSHAHIVLKLPFLTRDDVQRNLDTVIDMRDVTPETCNFLGFHLSGRPRNCALFVRMLISERKSRNRTKDQEMHELISLWYAKISNDMGTYLENACKSLSANYFNPEIAILDVLGLRVSYNYKFKHAIELLQHSIIPCKSPEYIMLSRYDKTFNEIQINPSFESYLVSGIERFLLNRGKTLVDIFVEYIIRLNNTSSIGNEFVAVFISAMIQKHGFNVQEELNKWKNGQEFNLPSWITPTMRFTTISNLSGGVPIVEYVKNTTYYGSYAIQPDRFSGSDAVISLVDDKQDVILLSASCTISKEPVKQDKIKEQVFKSCMNFQYMVLKQKRKNFQIKDQEKEFSCREPEQLQIGFGNFLTPNEEVNSEEKEEEDLNYDDLDYDLDYAKNTENYQISKVSEHAKNHEEIKSFTVGKKHIYVSVELPHRAGKRSKLFRFNEYGDLMIIVDDRNMECVFGPVIKKLMEKISNLFNNSNSTPTSTSNSNLNPDSNSNRFDY
ncbi:hypothetical protein RhiirA4_538971 [Rhizophagus irregularis]|uniref:Crinkler effector protein N-terminal domain-containing protein n=1 Tax=Rhizophagus irregularis TaxID=588596 RepID=A0A2I1G1Z4_9GLOM|nr:hypothetical protein RhiirA4_538971 [Rhizophagus irregularis]